MFYAWITDLEACMTSFINGLLVAGELHKKQIPLPVNVGGAIVKLTFPTYQNFFKQVYIPAAKFAGLNDW